MTSGEPPAPRAPLWEDAFLIVAAVAALAIGWWGGPLEARVSGGEAPDGAPLASFILLRSAGILIAVVLVWMLVRRFIRLRKTCDHTHTPPAGQPGEKSYIRRKLSDAPRE